MLKFIVLLSIIFKFINLIICDDELLSVVVLYRHGDRTPTSLYPNDPYQNMSYWPEGFGQLTNKGKMQQYELGQWFRSRYDGFLSSRYSREEIYIRSTDVDRTLMSAAANLAGLYPPLEDQVWNEKLKWQPIPIHTIPKPEDPVLAMEKPCPRYDVLFEELQNSPYFQQINEQNQDLYEYLETNSGMEVRNIKDVKHLYSTFLIEGYFNLTIPEWAQKVFPDQLQPWAFLTFALPCYTPELARLKTGVFYNQLVAYFRSRIETPDTTQKFIMYSAHDDTISDLLNAIGAFQYHIPPYTSTIIMEQRQNLERNYINVYYKNSTELQNIRVRNCDFDCLIDDFEENLKPVSLTMDQWTEECKVLKC